MNNIKKQVIEAYSDCNKQNPFNKRNLDFCSDSLTGQQIIEIMPIAVPKGYNNFCSKNTIEDLVSFFDENAIYHIAREGSVCIYVNTNKSKFSDEKIARLLDADECNYDETKKQYRIWWD